MQFRFDFTKALQAAGVLLGAERARQMSYLRLFKLLYIADREMLAATGRPITGDHAVAMKHGPVLRTVYDLVKGQAAQAGAWDEYLHTDGYIVDLRADPGRGRLSKGEVAKLNELTARYRGMSDWELVEETHTFAEWRKGFREGAATPIPWADVLDAQGKANLASAVERDEEARRALGHVFGE
jgi:uncharacterized phage-associated protein